MQAIESFEFWKFLAGLGLFIFSMNMVERSLRGFSGRSIQKFIQLQAQHPFRIVVASIIITAILQSSSLLLMLVLTYCSAGILPVSAALLATLGANIGTTLDTWLIVLLGFEVQIENVIYPIIGCSSLLLAVSSEKSTLSSVASFFLGISILLLALEWLKYSLNLNSDMLPAWLVKAHYTVFILTGIILTAIIQSSLATAAIALSAIYHGVIAFDQAAALVIGAETGTTLKFLLASVNSSVSKKKVAFGNFYINLATTFLATLFLHPIIWLLKEKIGLQNELYALAALQSSFNLISMLLFVPILPQTEKFLNYQFGRSAPYVLEYLKSNNNESGNPLHPAYLEVLHLFNHVLGWNRRVLKIGQRKEEKTWRSFFLPQGTDHLYKEIKLLEGEILEYLSRPENQDMSPHRQDQRKQLINSCRYLGRSAKCLKDIQHNLSDFDIGLNDSVVEMIGLLRKHTDELFRKSELKMNVKDATSIPDKLLIENKEFYDSFNNELVVLLGQEKITELDMTNLLNINREVYESNKAFLKSIIEIVHYNQFIH